MDKFKLVNGKDKTCLTDRASAKSNYDAGYRAYSIFGNTVFKSPHGEIIPANNDELTIEWDSLRAYQDAERKKGVPIEINAKSANSWLTLSYGHFLSGNILKAATPGIDVFDQNGIIIGRFTNFRWRAGYPKGGNNG